MRTNLSVKEELRERYRNYAAAKEMIEARIIELRHRIQQDSIVDRGVLGLTRESLMLNEGMLRTINARILKIKEELGE